MIPATGEHNFVNDVCTICGAKPEILHYGQTLSLQDLIKIRFYFYMNTDKSVQEVGALLWTKEQYLEETDFTFTSEKARKYQNLKPNGKYYDFMTDGIYAQNLDNTFYMIPYAKTADGYIYGTAKEYSALHYIEGVYKITDPAWADTRSLVIDLVNYATAARSYFCLTEKLPVPAKGFNSILSEADRVVPFTDSLLTEYPEVSEKGAFAASYYGKNVNLLEAISVGTYYAKGTTVAGGYYWNAADYAKNSDHNANNKSGVTERIDINGGSYVNLKITGLYAFNIFDNYYVRPYNADGVLGDTIGTSVAAYLTQAIRAYESKTDATSVALVELAEAMLVYGDNARNNPAIKR